MARRLGLKLPEQDTLKSLSPEEEKAIRELDYLSRNGRAIPERLEKNCPLLRTDTRPPSHYRKNHIRQSPTNFPCLQPKELVISDKPVPQTTLLKYDKNTAQLYVGDAQNALYVLNSQLQLADTWWIDTPPTDIDFPKNAAPRLLTIGVFSPSDQQLGRLMTLERSAKPGSSPINIRDLPRPVQFASGDLNADGKDDVVICGFGNNAGKLFWYDGFEPTKEHVLKALPGARKVEIADFNQDKKPDIMVLMAQAREEVAIFYNQGNGRFREKTVLRFSPVFGSSLF